jgi:branched-chain amino acid aminotransferase
MKITKAQTLKQKPDFSNLGFGKYLTDHMAVITYDAASGGWGEPEIVPYGRFDINPASCVLHYGQGIFEGLKAYKNAEGKITMFRPRDNFERMNRSARRLCMPELDVDTALAVLKELVLLEQDWIPSLPGTSLYVRPFMFANEDFLGVHPSHKYVFAIILSPVGSYYAGGLAPTKIMIEDELTRASDGGTGEAKCMGNYAASLLGAEKAKKLGFEQVLWLDSAHKKYAEEVGSMNIFFVVDGVVVTPSLDGSILPGITRDSSLKLLRRYGFKVEERRISVDELMTAQKDGKLNEVFGTGTAAVISPVGTIGYKGESYVINDNKMGKITEWLYDRLTGIQTGRYPDEFGWIESVK